MKTVLKFQIIKEIENSSLAIFHFLVLNARENMEKTMHTNHFNEPAL